MWRHRQPAMPKSGTAVSWRRQVCCVVRHAERADAPFALYEGLPWTRSSDCRRWPFDPPLSDDGELGALETAAAVKGFLAKAGSRIDVVVTSPYLRCVQTAAEICKALGEETRLMIDASVGEIFGPSIFGHTEPQKHLRPLRDLLKECERRGVRKYLPRQLGESPSWSEDLYDGRQRFVESFLKYMERSCRSSNNFMVVTHGDHVGATAALLPKDLGHIYEVEPGGGIFASRELKKQRQTSLEYPVSEDAGVGSSESSDFQWGGMVADAAPSGFSTDQLIGGWTAHTFGIKFAQRETKRPGGLLRTMIRSMQNFSRKSKLPQDRVRSLLRAFSGDELGTLYCPASAPEHLLSPRNVPNADNNIFSSGSSADADSSEDVGQRNARRRTITSDLFCRQSWATQELEQYRKHADLESPKSPGPSQFEGVLPQPSLEVPGMIVDVPKRELSLETVSSSSLLQRRKRSNTSWP